MVTRAVAVRRTELRGPVHRACSTLHSNRRPLGKRSGRGDLNGDLALLFIARAYRLGWEHFTIVLIFTPFHMDGTGPSGVGSHAVYPLQDIQTGFSETFSRYSPGYTSETPFSGLAIRDSVRGFLILPRRWHLWRGGEKDWI